MVTDIITYLIAPTVTAAVAWFFSRRKYKADANSLEIDNEEKRLAFHGKEIDALMERINMYRDEAREREMLELERETAHMKAIRDNKLCIEKLKNALITHFCSVFPCDNRTKDKLENIL